MNNLPLTSIEIKDLSIFSNPRDVLRDLFVYVDYVGQHNIKRMARTNEIPRPDQQRIAKLLGGLTINPDQGEINASKWIDFIDHLAYGMRVVDYDTEGEYRSVQSEEPVFFENYITINKAILDEFLELTPSEQEEKILAVLKAPQVLSVYRDFEYSELFQTSVLGRLDSFSIRGTTTEVIPSITFSKIRQFLLDLLLQCTPGVWYAMESLVQYLKADHPYFLIPEIIPPDQWGKTAGRYDNFYETEDQRTYGTNTIKADATDAFERVEGRYVERFLENIPLIMRFVDLAYDPSPYKGLFPTRGTLKAFRVNESFLQLMHGVTILPRVTIQPNFDVIVESDFYPAKIVRQVGALGELVSSPSNGSPYVGIFQLKKTRVAAEKAQKPSLDVISLLEGLSHRELPPNVQIELEEWSGHADQFTLYEGFALFECADAVPSPKKITVERISPNLTLVRDAKDYFQKLEIDGCIPLWVHHLQDRFLPLTEIMISVFPKETLEEKLDTVKQIKVSRIISVMILFPDEESFDAFRKMLAELRCPFQSDARARSIIIDQKNQALFDAAVQALAEIYTVVIE